jgi:hypothetical protein
MAANDYTGRIWKILPSATNPQTPFGTANVKFEGGTWSGFTAAGQTFTITDVDGRVYTWESPTTASIVNFQKLGWLSGPLTFGGTFTGEIDLFLGTR